MRFCIPLWKDLSVRGKSSVIIGSMLFATWFLVFMLFLRLQSYTKETGAILDEYTEISQFQNSFFSENRILDIYVRPSSDNLEDYLHASEATDRAIRLLAPQWGSGVPEADALKRALENSLIYYRDLQKSLLETPRDSEGFVDIYVSMTRSASYIHSYAYDLLELQMRRGSEAYRLTEERNQNGMRQFMIGLFIASALMIASILAFSQSIVRPLAALGNAAREIRAGRYDAPPLKVIGKDELSVTASSFNLMQEEIGRTIEKLKESAKIEKDLRESEVRNAQLQQALQLGRFAQLQSQINPHFLFNTLNTIAALAREENAPVSEDLIMRLSSFFRYSLQSDELMVPLKREVSLLRDYMELQSARYGDRIEMEIVEYADADELMVPKFILQPLVENSIIHGLKGRESGGRIRVRVTERDGTVRICVVDNGCGFDTEKKEESRDDRRSIGLSNIGERVRFTGGSFRLRSVPGTGTGAMISYRREQDV